MISIHVEFLRKLNNLENITLNFVLFYSILVWANYNHYYESTYIK